MRQTVLCARRYKMGRRVFTISSAAARYQSVDDTICSRDMEISGAGLHSLTLPAAEQCCISQQDKTLRQKRGYRGLIDTGGKLEAS